MSAMSNRPGPPDCSPHRLSRSADRLRRRLKRLLWCDKALAFLSTRCGWNDGGCAILALAVQAWLGETNAHLAGIWADSRIQHVVCRLGPGYYIDGDGVSTYRRLLVRWEFIELGRVGDLGAVTTAQISAAGIPLPDPALTRALAKYLGQAIPGGIALLALDAI